ncbi:MAG: GFA family protein [Pseudomonadales bacterium]
MTSKTAYCVCGQLQIEVSGNPLGVGVCHCLSCQKRTGSVFATLAAFRPPFTVLGASTEYTRTGDRGSRFTFRFCPTCGSTVFHTEEGNEDVVMVAVGTFGDPDFAAPEDSVYDCRRHPWVKMPEGVSVFDKDPP